MVEKQHDTITTLDGKKVFVTAEDMAERWYEIRRIPHEILDEGMVAEVLPVIYRFKARVGDPETVTLVGCKERLDAWILKQGIDWLKKDRRYWKDLFLRAERETFIPGENVMHMGNQPHRIGEVPQQYHMTKYFWDRFCRKSGLPLGTMPNFDGMWVTQRAKRWDPALQQEYEVLEQDFVPRTHTKWLKVLRFWIRHEHQILNTGARRGIEDYPLEVQLGLKLAIDLMVRELDCVDNIRFAQTDKPAEMRRFRRAEANGCCGSAQRYVIIGNKQFIVGCNYGH